LSCEGADEAVDEAFWSGFQGCNRTKDRFVAGLLFGRSSQYYKLHAPSRIKRSKSRPKTPPYIRISNIKFQISCQIINKSIHEPVTLSLNTNSHEAPK
jgi:hypothetical protein